MYPFFPSLKPKILLNSSHKFIPTRIVRRMIRIDREFLSNINSINDTVLKMTPGMIQGPIKFNALMQILTSLLLDVITGTTSVDPLACLNKPKQANDR